MNLITIKTGKANMHTSLSECYAFYCPRTGTNQVETFIGKAAREFRGRTDAPIREHGSVVIVPSLNDVPSEIGGAVGHGTYEIQDGSIIKLVCKRRLGWNSTVDSGICFLKTRENAAHCMLRFIPVPSNSLSFDWLGIQGRFDVISLSEAEGFGATINPASRKLLDIATPNMFTTTIIEPETLPPVGFVPVGKEGKMMPTLKRRRRITKA